MLSNLQGRKQPKHGGNGGEEWKGINPKWLLEAEA